MTPYTNKTAISKPGDQKTPPVNVKRKAAFITPESRPIPQNTPGSSPDALLQIAFEEVELLVERNRRFAAMSFADWIGNNVAKNIKKGKTNKGMSDGFSECDRDDEEVAEGDEGYTIDDGHASAGSSSGREAETPCNGRIKRSREDDDEWGAKRKKA
jgi:hypothetical protein